MKIRKKPIVVEAWKIDLTEMQYNGEMPSWVYQAWKEDKTIGLSSDGHDMVLHIKTMEGIMTAKEGDVLVRGVNDELYAINEAIFIKTYDVVDVEDEKIFTREEVKSDILIESIEDMPDGSAIVHVDMDYETLKLFAKRGLHATLIEAAEKIIKEHGDV
jgi:hypothetical protein